MRIVRHLMIVVAGLVLAACGGPAGPSGTITLETLQNGQVVSSNVLVRGSFSQGLTVSSLAFSVNGGTEVDVTATIQGRDFVFTIAGSLFVQGPNVIRIVLRPTAGSPVSTIINVVFDSGAAPPVGADLVVFNDINPFDEVAMLDTNNVRFVQNLVDFAGSGSRGSGTTVWFDRGRGSACGGDGFCNDAALSAMVDTIEAAGYDVVTANSAAGTLTSIAPGVKVIVFWTPTVTFTAAEINTLKAFAANGGRIVYIGEHAGYYPAAGIAAQNRFLEDMGAVMRNTGGAIDCVDGSGYPVLPATSLRPSALTAGLTQLTMACASVIELGPADYAIFFDKSNTVVLAGVATIDVTPLAFGAAAASVPARPQPAALPSRGPAGN